MIAYHCWVLYPKVSMNAFAEREWIVHCYIVQLEWEAAIDQASIKSRERGKRRREKKKPCSTGAVRLGKCHVACSVQRHAKRLAEHSRNRVHGGISTKPEGASR